MPTAIKSDVYDPEDPNGDLTDRLLDALSNSLRRRMLRSLIQEPASAKTLSATYGLPRGNVSYHLSTVLFERCGLIKIVGEYDRRGAREKVFALRPDAYLGIINWPTIPVSLRSGVRGLALSNFVMAAIASLEAEPDSSMVSNIFMWQPVAVNRDGQREIAAAGEVFDATVASVASRCAMVKPGELIQLNVGTAVFEAPPGSVEETA